MVQDIWVDLVVHTFTNDTSVDVAQLTWFVLLEPVEPDDDDISLDLSHRDPQRYGEGVYDHGKSKGFILNWSKKAVCHLNSSDS